MARPLDVPEEVLAGARRGAAAHATEPLLAAAIQDVPEDVLAECDLEARLGYEEI